MRPAPAATGTPLGRVRRLACWLVVSVVAGALGVLVGGAVEAHRTGAGGLAGVVLIGYAALVAWPALLVAGVGVRLLWRGWHPEALAATLVEPDGSAPRLAGWVAYVGLASFVMSWAVFNGIRWLAHLTTFKPTVVALFTPPIAVLAGLVLVAASRPGARALGWLAARVDRLPRRLARRSVLTPRWILAWAILLAIVLASLGWFVSIAPRVGYVDLGVLVYPLTTLAAAAAAHPLWRRGRSLAPRVLLGAGVATATVAALTVGLALVARARWPITVLEVWSHPTMASDVIEQLYALEDVRADISMTVARPAPRPPGPGEADLPRDVVLVTIDTVRADRTPLLGGPAQMPHLAALGRAGVVLPWAFSPGNVTRRSIPALATGLHPTRVRGKVAGWALRLDPRHILLAERFRAAGYDTVGYFCCESFWGPRHRLGINRGIDHLVIEPDGDKLSEQARAWLEARRARIAAGDARPMFLWVHFLEPHNWMQAGNPADDDERRRRYDASLAEVDRYLGVILGGLPTTGPRQPFVVVTADHGEALGEHGTPYHSSDLYNSQLRVPLVVTGPGLSPRRLGEPVGLVDLAPTLLDLAGFAPPTGPDVDGKSLRDLVTGARLPEPAGGLVYAAMITDRSVASGARAVIKGTWKLIETRRGAELYDLAADPHEARDQAKQQPARVAELRALLTQLAARDRVSPFTSLR